MHRVGEMPDGLDIEVGLHHSADQLEDLVGDEERPVGDDDARSELCHGSRRSVFQIAGQLDEVGEHTAAGGRFHLLHCEVAEAADIELFPIVVGERRAGQPAPAREALDRGGGARFEAQQMWRQVGLAGHDQTAVLPCEPALDACDGLCPQMTGIGDQQRTQCRQLLLR